MTSTLPRTAVFLKLDNPKQAVFIEELLWTIDGVESVTFHMDGETHFQGLQVIAHHQKLDSNVVALLKQHELEGTVSLQRSCSIAEEDWAESWKQFWHVNRILPNLVIQPSWESFIPEPGDTVLQLDPGSAFGTGTHETTQLMLFLIDDRLRSPVEKPGKLLDVGTGSGILALYAAKVSGISGLAIDNDPVAVGVSQENIARNGASALVECSGADVRQLAENTYDLVLANILAPVLVEMMQDLKRVMTDGGSLLLSGVTIHQLGTMLESIASQGLSLQRILQKGEWLALVCQK